MTVPNPTVTLVELVCALVRREVDENDLIMTVLVSSTLWTQPFAPRAQAAHHGL